MKLFGSISGLIFSVVNAFAGDVTGHAYVTKHLTKKALSPIVYNLRGTAGPAPLPDTEPANEFDRMVVILEGANPEPGPPVAAVLNQQGSRFDPELIVVPTGSSVQFPNFDPIFHNVFSLSGAKKFDLGYYPAGQTRIVKFDEPGVVQVYCHLHPNMYAAIVVVPNRWYAKPGDDGTFAFHDVPPGTYRLVAWHINAGFFRREVHVAATGGTDVVVDIPVRDEERSR